MTYLRLEEMKHLVEELAALEHQQWITLMEFMQAAIPESFHSLDEYIEHCKKKGLFKPYSELTEQQKESDRPFAFEIVKLLIRKNVLE
jgi:hypothetical protein